MPKKNDNPFTTITIDFSAKTVTGAPQSGSNKVISFRGSGSSQLDDAIGHLEHDLRNAAGTTIQS